MNKRLAGKRVLITGAGSGLGRALALGWAGRGWRVAVSDIDPERIEQTVKMVDGAGGQALGITCDVTQPESLAAAALAVRDAWGGVDVVVNNAGVSAYGDMETIPLERWRWIMDINLMGCIYGCKTFIPMLAQQGGGHIVNVASYLAFLSAPGSACYNLTKAAILSLSETLRIELSGKNIGVSVLMPSFFQTNLMEQLYCEDKEKETMIRTLFDRSSFPAEKVAERLIRAVEKNRFYVLPQWDAWLLWRVKRWLPGTYLKVFSFLYRRNVIQKVLGV